MPEPWISLTLVDLSDESFSVAIVPHTRDVTSLQSKGVGSRVNLEVDAIGRYVVSTLSRWRDEAGIDLDLLRRAGFTADPAS